MYVMISLCGHPLAKPCADSKIYHVATLSLLQPDES